MNKQSPAHKLLDNGAFVTMEWSAPTGFWKVLLRDPKGEVYDKVNCDTKSMAEEYFRAFKAVARNL